MPYAIVQKTLDPPEVEQLVRAFESVAELTRLDAIKLCRQAFGILVRGRTLPIARTVQRALLNEGVDTWVVDQQRLPKPPPAKALRKAFVREGGLAAFDMYGRETLCPWSGFGIAGAGSVTVRDAQRKVTQIQDVVGGLGMGGMAVVTRTKVTHSHTDRTELMLDLFMDRAPHRYVIEAAHFNYETLGDRASHSKEDNFALLASDILAQLPHAAFNMGAAALAENPTDIFLYPSRGTYEEEITWLLWQAAETPGIVG